MHTQLFCDGKQSVASKCLGEKADMVGPEAYCGPTAQGFSRLAPGEVTYKNHPDKL